MKARLELDGLSRSFGGIRAISEIDLTVLHGEIFGIIGPNGAGKTTLFNVVAGLYRPSQGRVVLDGAEIGGLAPGAIARSGLARTFQSPRCFKAETVAENFRRACDFSRIGSPYAFIRGKLAPGGKPLASAQWVEEIAVFAGLSDVLDKPAGSLAYGLQKALGLGMALAQKPTLILMDEPAAGLNPTEKQTMATSITRLRADFLIDVVVIEHDMRLIMGVCDRIAVLNHGRLLKVGTPDQIRSDRDVIEAYLGSEHETA
jgi:branched-chain amino acid transport system ATP-binding protein